MKPSTPHAAVFLLSLALLLALFGHAPRWLLITFAVAAVLAHLPLLP